MHAKCLKHTVSIFVQSNQYLITIRVKQDMACNLINKKNHGQPINNCWCYRDNLRNNGGKKVWFEFIIMSSIMC